VQVVVARARTTATSSNSSLAAPDTPGRRRRGHRREPQPERGPDHHAKIELELLDAYNGAERNISLRGAKLDASGHVVTEDRTLNVKIPKG
jgi:curved DNA-binding protein